MKLSVALRLGRVSNLPTVWTNVFTGVALAGTAVADTRLAILLVSLSLFYVGGMFLNDAFDSAFDARSRPERPIPSGQVSAAQVYAVGFGMLAIAIGLLAWAGFGFEPFTQWRPALAGIALAIAITFYNWHHKDNPLSPLVMGLCRLLVYLAAAYAVAMVPPQPLLLAATVLLCYLIGLTYTAKQEHLDRLGALWPLAFLAVPVVYGIWLVLRQPSALLPLSLFVGWTLYALWLLRRRARGDVPRAVVSLIAGIALLDSMILAGHGAPLLAGLAVVAFVLTLSLQRWVSGT
ncbi:MAG TPA: UbiA family prenyltransferase [Burkholderiales bacterium]|nr:UbiA family prenyltransferase [Burkholderiales bacterium]